ncbi:MAG: hypothetical protein R6V12_16450 [Candidatus Hydrogenedentota bacterium]
MASNIGTVDNVSAMPNDNRLTHLLWAGLELAWGSRAFWAYRALVYGAGFLAGVAIIALWGLLAYLFGFLAALLLFVLGAGTVFLLALNGVLRVAFLSVVETEHALLLVELHRQRETPRGHGQIAWARERGETGDVPPAWLKRHIRGSMEAIHSAVHDVGDPFPAFAENRAPTWARWLLARCKQPMAEALAGRAFVGETAHTAYDAKKGLLLYTTVWPRAFKLNVALWALGQAAMLLVATILAVPAGMATAPGPFSVMASFVAVALWLGFAVKRIVIDPILQAAIIIAFETIAEGSSIAPDTEVLLLEVSEAFRELDARARETSELEETQSLERSDHA